MTTTDTSRGADLYERAQKIIPGGASRNTVLRKPRPDYVESAEGCRITDIDGVTRLDFSNNMASLIHGHADPDIHRAVTEQLAKGTAYMMATEIEVRYAEHLCARSDSFEMIRFVNSGTEAVMLAIKAARAFTGRPTIAKAEGAYHGVYDYAEVSQAPAPDNWGDVARPQSVPLVVGTPESALNDVVVFPYNDIDRAIARLDENAGRLACVVMDLMPHRVGLNPANPEFVRAIRDWCDRNGALLVLDEVITFRTEYSGLQSRFGVTPDLTALGKMIGGGFPIGAVAGRAEVMDILNPNSGEYRHPVSGTFTANPISMTAGLAAMGKFDRDAVTRLNALSDRARDGIAGAIRATGARACVTGTGSMFRVHLKENPPKSFREAYLDPDETARLRELVTGLYDRGLLLIGTCAGTLSTPMTEADVDEMTAAFESAFAEFVANS